jgi:hypothetical protein
MLSSSSPSRCQRQARGSRSSRLGLNLKGEVSTRLMNTLGPPLEFIASMSAYAALLATAAGLICVPAYVLYERSRSLADFPGPPNPSLLVGNVVDLRRAPTRTRWNVWQDQYGSTYRMAGPFLVRASQLAITGLCGLITRELQEPILVLGDPRGATHVLTNNVANYPRPELDRIVLGQWVRLSGLNIESLNGALTICQFGPSVFTADGQSAEFVPIPSHLSDG